MDSHLALRQSVARARQEIADAVKAVEERDKNRSKAKSTSVAAPTGTSADGNNLALATGSLSLFDSKDGASNASEDAQ